MMNTLFALLTIFSLGGLSNTAFAAATCTVIGPNELSRQASAKNLPDCVGFAKTIFEGAKKEAADVNAIRFKYADQMTHVAGEIKSKKKDAPSICRKTLWGTSHAVIFGGVLRERPAESLELCYQWSESSVGAWFPFGPFDCVAHGVRMTYIDDALQITARIRR